MKSSKWFHWGALWLIAILHLCFLIYSTFLDGFMSGNPEDHHRPLKIWVWGFIISTLLIWFINYGKNLHIKITLQFALMPLFRQIHDIQYFYIVNSYNIKNGYWVHEPTKKVQYSYALGIIITIILIIWFISVRLKNKVKKKI
jgi:hypothetical protein